MHRMLVTEESQPNSRLSSDHRPAIVPESNLEKRRAVAARRRLMKLLGRTFRCMILDVALFVMLSSCAFVAWVNHVHDEYLEPQFHAMNWDDDRSYREITYYQRPCGPEDITTRNGADLFLPKNASTEEAYWHHLRHGFTIFKHVLSHKTANSLRRHVTSRNRNLTEAESIFVIEGDNRFSFGLTTETPEVATAMMELTNHEQLNSAVQKILGPEPALIEMTAITSSYGAVHQYWHDDVVPYASTVRYARTFGPSYSIFIQLQDTTKEMGATSSCPGSHYCSDGGMAEVCDQEGFQLVGENGLWERGDALLMNMNSFHRGAAHTDPHALDRVMLILTFVPKPRPAAESRMMSQGITFSLRWDMWGHTWRDLQRADTVMRYPWALLRTFGLYKPRDAFWGVDYVSSSYMRMAAEDNGFDEESMEFLINNLGGLPFLPAFLQPDVDPSESHVWFYYLSDTMHNLHAFMQAAIWPTIAIFVILSVVTSIVLESVHASRGVIRASSRLMSISIFVYGLWVFSIHHVNTTHWAKDIRAYRRYGDTTLNDERFGVRMDGVSAFPTRHDVLVENRYGSSDYLDMYKDWINNHPGNKRYSQLVASTSPYIGDVPKSFEIEGATYIYEKMRLEHARFLEHGLWGTWFLLRKVEAVKLIRKELRCARSKPLRETKTAIKQLITEYRYGVLRNTTLAYKHSVPYLRDIEERIFPMLPEAGTSSNAIFRTVLDSAKAKQGGETDEENAQGSIQTRFFSTPLDLSPPQTVPSLVRSECSTVVPEEPFSGAWIASGSRAEVLTEGHWYIGFVKNVSAHGSYFVEFPDGDEGYFSFSRIRRVIPYEEGERLEVLVEDDDGSTYYEYCEIVSEMDDGTFHVLVAYSGDYYDEIYDTDFRRRNMEMIRNYEYRAAY